MLRVALAPTLILIVSGCVGGLSVLSAGCGESQSGDARATVAQAPAPPTLVAFGGGLAPQDVRWSADGRDLLMVRSDGSSGRAVLYSVATTGELRRKRRFPRGVTAAAVGPTGATAEYSDNDNGGLVRVRDGGRVVASLRVQPSVFDQAEMIWSPDGHRLLIRTEGTRKPIRLLDVRTRQPLPSLDAPASYLDRQLWSRDSKRIVLPITRGLARINVGTGRRSVMARLGSQPAKAAWSPVGRWIAVTSSGRLELVDERTARKVLLTGRGINDPVWAPDGKRLAYIGTSADPGQLVVNVLVLTDDGRLQTTQTLRAGDDDGQGSMLTWSPDGTRLAVSLDALV